MATAKPRREKGTGDSNNTDKGNTVTDASGERMFTAEEVIQIANETSDSWGNLFRLDFIGRIRHEADLAEGGAA